MTEQQQHILDLLLDHPEGLSTSELCEPLRITKTAVREYLLRLETSGHVIASDVRSGVGRPIRKYQLSAAGREVFPRKYSWLTSSILALMTEHLNRATLDAILEQLARNTAAPIKLKLDHKPTLAEKLAVVAEEMNALGYRAKVVKQKPADTFDLVASNCVYHEVAVAHPVLCQFDVSLLRIASGLEVKLTECMAKGGSVCRFCVSRA